VTLTAAPAHAERSYDSQITGFTNPHGFAIDGSDQAWVSDPGNSGLITEYNAYPSQTSIGQQTGGGAFGCGGTYPWSLDINDSNGYLDVADSCQVVVDIFDNTGALSKTFSSNFGGGYDYLAVDNSGGSTNGDIYVASTNGLLQRFDGNGNPDGFSGAAGYISGNKITGTPGGSFGNPWNVATDTSGNVYVVDQTHRVVDEFDSSGTFVRAFDGSGAPTAFSGNLTGVAVDPTSGNILVADAGNSVVDEFDSAGVYLDQLTGTGPSEETPFGSLPGGIGVNSSGYVYVVDGGGHAVDIFTPNAILPKVTYGAVTDQTQTSGTLNASIDLNGGPEVTSCHFQYGTTTEYGSSIACSPSTPYLGNTSVSAGLSGLTTETTYHYRLVLVTANGTKNSLDQTYLPHAVPGLTTQPATNVARNTATLNASFNGNGEDTHYYFEWGTSGSYGNTTAAPPGTDAGSPSGAEPLHFDLSGLTVETTYHYRIVASNAAGTSRGADQSFKTLAAVEELSTDVPSNITASTATLNASYSGIGEDVHYYFEFGPDTDYGSTTAAPPGTDNGSPSGPQELSFNLDALDINATYHYRVVASDAAGTTFGSDRTFTTLGRYEFATEYGSPGSGDGQLLGPKDVAVDASSGDIYVADTGNHRVVKTDSAGHFLAAWGWGVGDGNASSEVCASGCQAGVPGSGAGQLTTPEFIEVDNSTGPSAGDVYVADTADGLVQKFDPAGHLIWSWGTGGGIDFSSGGTIGGITVGIVGDLFVLTDDSPYYWTELGQDGVYKVRFNAGELGLGSPAGTGIEIDSFGGFYEPQQGAGVNYRNPDASQYSGHLIPAAGNAGLAVDRSTNDVYVDQGQYIEQFATVVPPGCGHNAGAGTIGQGCGATDTFGSGSLASGAGLGFNSSTGMLYAADAGAGDVAVFSPLPLPDVTTGPATGVGASSGTLTGEVDPHGPGQVSDCYFQYGTDLSYGLGTVPCSPGGPISGPAGVTAGLSGLEPSATYHYRLVAIRADGKGLPGYGHDRTFTPSPTLAPTIGSTSVGEASPTTAMLTAQINPNLLPTVYRFQYGTDTGYGSQTPTSGSIGEDGVAHAVSSMLSGLTPGATYHYRVVAVNFNGATNGPDGTFSTPDAPSVATGAAMNVSQSGATLGASIRPGFRSTTYHFEYGPTTSYGTSTPESPQIGSDDAVHPATADISGLTASTTYHYRVVATNAIGTADGPDQSFTTAALPTQTFQPAKCKAGFVKRGGKCVKRHHRKPKHKKRSHT
jgi:phosphodiesterase/alkaline phosphatase D-like protein/DNA-binding beta-propeller fold protein YncE